MILDSNAYLGWVDDVEIISVDGSNLIFKGFRYENPYLVDFNASEQEQHQLFVQFVFLLFY